MSHKIAIVWRGDAAARAAASPENNRYCRIFSALQALGIEAEPAVYCEETQDEVRAQLMNTDGALVWVNPLEGDRTREKLDELLRDVAATGRLVSAHPDVILKMGVKEVLHRTKHLGWGTDTRLYRNAAEFRDQFPPLLGSAEPRVIKQNRGNAGQGVWKVERPGQPTGSAPVVTVLEARRGSLPETLPLEKFMARCEAYFDWGGCIIDQPFLPRLTDGMIRCYMGVDRVVGFGHQKIKALIPPPPEGPDAPSAQPGPRYMHGPDAAPFSGASDEDGGRMDATDDERARDGARIASNHLGRRLSLWAKRRNRRGYLCSLRNQREQRLRDSRSGAGRDCASGS